jgi:hypothetical protein
MVETLEEDMSDAEKAALAEFEAAAEVTPLQY